MTGYFKFAGTVFALLLFFSVTNAQRPEVTISLNEAFLDSLLDAVFQNSPPIEFSIASNRLSRADAEMQSLRGASENDLEGSGINPGKRYGPVFSFSATPSPGTENRSCKEVIQLLRETNGVRTAVRFRDGKILAPLAFSGNYNPPLVGCVPFTGYAETTIDLEFDQQNQRVVARARVLNVSLNGTGGVGGSLIAKMVQGSIDKKINPIEVVRLDKLSFAVPVRNSTSLNMKAVGIRTGVENGALNIHVAYDFVK